MAVSILPVMLMVSLLFQAPQATHSMEDTHSWLCQLQSRHLGQPHLCMSFVPERNTSRSPSMKWRNPSPQLLQLRTG